MYAAAAIEPCQADSAVITTERPHESSGCCTSRESSSALQETIFVQSILGAPDHVSTIAANGSAAGPGCMCSGRAPSLATLLHGILMFV